MKRWWHNVVKDYFSFTSRERKGILVMIIAGIIIYFFFRYVPIQKQTYSKDAFQKELADLKITIDSSKYAKQGRDEDDEYYYRPKQFENHNNYNTKGELFTFDPNTLDAEGWKRLGVRDKTINTIQNFLNKGYKFRTAEDIKRIYGLRPQEAERLVPYVRIASTENAVYALTATSKPAFPNATVKEVAAPKIIEINNADTSALIALPGIGSKLANRIITFRDKLGGFTSINQLSETYGLPDSTFQKIKPRLEANLSSIKKININTSEVNDLRTHPYLKWNIANAIVNYRKQHGNFKTIDDIRKIDIITDDLFNKIAPYLAL